MEGRLVSMRKFAVMTRSNSQAPLAARAGRVGHATRTLARQVPLHDVILSSCPTDLHLLPSIRPFDRIATVISS